MPDPRFDVPSRSLVTGATGLLGSRIVIGLLERGGAVTALVRDLERGRRLLPDHPALTIVEGDVTDVSSYRRHLPGVEVAFHTAAYFREYYQPGADLARLERTNVGAVEDLLLATARADVPVVVHTSTVGVLGFGSEDSPADERTPPGPAQLRNDYFVSKMRAEEAVARCVAATGQRVPVVLPGWMWGPGDAGPTTSGWLFLAVASGAMKAIPRAGHHVVDARDVADACLRAASSGATCRRYVVAGRWYPIPEVVAAVAAATGVPTPPSMSTRLLLTLARLAELPSMLRRRPGGASVGLRSLVEGSRCRYSSARAERELGVSFRPLAHTMPAEAEWYREHGMLRAPIA